MAMGAGLMESGKPKMPESVARGGEPALPDPRPGSSERVVGQGLGRSACGQQKVGCQAAGVFFSPFPCKGPQIEACC